MKATSSKSVSLFRDVAVKTVCTMHNVFWNLQGKNMGRIVWIISLVLAFIGGYAISLEENRVFSTVSECPLKCLVFLAKAKYDVPS